MPLTFLVTSPRVPPGLMSWAAWQAVASADQVLASDDRSPLFRAVTAAGHRVDVLPSPSVAGLLALAADSGVVWLADDEEATSFPPALAERIVTAEDAPEVEVLHGSYDVPGARLLDLVTVMDRLRTSCPWDKEQTHESLARYLLEETYETLEAIETEDYAHLREELGDLLKRALPRLPQSDPPTFPDEWQRNPPVVALSHKWPDDPEIPHWGLFSLARRIADNRVIAGLHFHIDNIAGALLAKKIDGWFADNAECRRLIEAAAKEFPLYQGAQ